MALFIKKFMGKTNILAARKGALSYTYGEKKKRRYLFSPYSHVVVLITYGKRKLACGSISHICCLYLYYREKKGKQNILYVPILRHPYRYPMLPHLIARFSTKDKQHHRNTPTSVARLPVALCYIYK